MQAIDIINPTTNAVATTLILGTVKYIHVRNDMLNERGFVDCTKLRPIGRLGDISYGTLGGAFHIPWGVASWTEEVKEDIEKALSNGT